MQNTNIVKDAKDDLKISKVFRHKYTDPQVHKSLSLKKWKKTKYSDVDLKLGMKYIEKFNPFRRTINDGFPDCSFSFCREIHFIGKSLIYGKLVSWVINEKLIPGYNLETKKYDPSYNPPTGEVFLFNVDFIRGLEDKNSHVFLRVQLQFSRITTVTRWEFMSTKWNSMASTIKLGKTYTYHFIKKNPQES